MRINWQIEYTIYFIREIFILNPDIAKLYIDGLNHYSELDAASRFRFAMLLRNIFGALQAGYARHLRFKSDPTEFENNLTGAPSLLR